MKKNLKNSKKQVSIELEDYSLEFFVSKFYKLNDYKSMFSLVIPGYPSNFIMKGFNELDSEFLTESDREKKLSIIFPQISTENNEKNLIQSIFFEIEIVRKIILNREKNLLLTKIDCDLFSNPYSLFLFDEFMETNFKKSKNNKKNSILTEKQLKNSDFQNFFYNVFKILLKTTDIIGIKPTNASFYLFLFYCVFIEFYAVSFCPLNKRHYLFLDPPGTLFILSYRIVLYNCWLSLIGFLLKSIYSSEFFSKLICKSRKYFSLLTSSDSNIFEKEFSLDTVYFLDIFNIRTLLVGIIRSGNMCSL
jgi:hypothetical protein